MKVDTFSVFLRIDNKKTNTIYLTPFPGVRREHFLPKVSFSDTDEKVHSKHNDQKQLQTCLS